MTCYCGGDMYVCVVINEYWRDIEASDHHGFIYIRSYFLLCPYTYYESIIYTSPDSHPACRGMGSQYYVI